MVNRLLSLNDRIFGGSIDFKESGLMIKFVFLIMTSVISLISFKAYAVPPQWSLSGLEKSFIYYSNVPTQQCLQEAVDRISGEFSGGDKASSTLVSEIFKVARAYGLDPIIFLGLVNQESGDFKPHDGVNGTGVAQLTAISIRDACHTLETTDCEVYKKEDYANGSYEEIWKHKTHASISALFNVSSNYESYYPWRRYCQKDPLQKIDRCNAKCNISADCVAKIDKAMMADNRVNLNLAGLNLLNFLGQAEKNMPGASMKDKYRSALEHYNGNPKHKKAYPTNIFNKLERIKTFCKFS